MRLTENEAIQLLQCMLGGIGQKSLAAKMGMDAKTISDALNDSTRLYRNPTRDATKEFFDNCLDESMANVSAYIASAYEWLAAKEPGYSNEILAAIAKENPITADGENIDWSSIQCAEELESRLKLLPSLDKVKAVLKECIQIESWLEHKIRANRGNRPARQKQETRFDELHQYDRETRALETARAKQGDSLPTEHVRRGWLVERVLHADGSVIVVEAPAGYGKTTLLDSIVLDKSLVAASLQCKWDDPVRSEQTSILEALNDQLSSVSVSYRDAIEHMSKATESPSDKINSMISAMQKAGSEPQPIKYITLDALDELKDSRHVLNLLDRLAMAGGFGWLKVVCSTRKWEAGREDRGYYVVRPLEELTHTKSDIEAYALKRLKSVMHSKGDSTTGIASTIADRSNGIFQYAVIVLDALCSGVVDIDDLDELPSDIFSLYDWYLARYLDGGSASDKDDLITILNMVAASAAPVPEEIITCALSLGSRRWGKTKSSLERFLVCTRTDAGTLYSFFHKSFADYLFSNRHGGKSAEEEGVAFLALGCYRAKGLDRLSYWAKDYIQVYLAWLLYRANNNALLDVLDFDLRAARCEVLHDEAYAKSCIDHFELAQDVIVFQMPAREEVLAWSALKVFDALLSQEEERTGNPRCNAPAKLLGDWLFSCNHYIFVLVSTSHFDEAFQVSREVISSMGGLDIRPAEAASDPEKELFQEYAVLYETVAYDVLTVGQPQAQDEVKVSDYYDKAIDLYASQDDAEGYLKAACNKSLYEVEHVDAKKALDDIGCLVSSCGLQESLSMSAGCDELIEIANPCRAGAKTRIKAESAFNHMNNLGYCLTLAGKEVEGLRLFGICEALAFDEAGIDKGGPYSEHDKAELFHLEAIAFYRLGEYEKAIEYEKRSIPGLQDVWGAESSKLCGPYNMLGNAMLSKGMAAEAVIYFEKALAIASSNWAPGHTRLINIRLNLARAVTRLGMAEVDLQAKLNLISKAELQLKEVQECADRLHGQNPWEDPDPSFLKMQLVTCEILEAQANYHDALHICEKIADAYRLKAPSDERALGTTLLYLAELYSKVGLYQEATRVLDDCKSTLSHTLNTLSGDLSHHPQWACVALLENSLSRAD